MRNPKISVVIPIYNTVQYLEKCLRSVCAQTYKNLEIIGVDDGSTDGSREILQAFAAEDSRIVAIYKENGGESSARNAGLQRCTGDYIGFMDCDDWIEPDMYEKLLRQAEQYPLVDIVACGYSLDTDIASIPAENTYRVADGSFDRHQLLEYVYHRDFYRAFTGYIWCKLYRRNLVQNSDGQWLQFDETLPFGGDMVFFAEVALRVRQAIYVNRPFYHYYQRVTSTYHSDDESVWIYMVYAYLKILQSFRTAAVEPDILLWVIRFLVYRAEVVAKLAYKHQNKEILEYCLGIMKQYGQEYKDTNRDHPERIQEYQMILAYKI